MSITEKNLRVKSGLILSGLMVKNPTILHSSTRMTRPRPKRRLKFKVVANQYSNLRRTVNCVGGHDGLPEGAQLVRSALLDGRVVHFVGVVRVRVGVAGGEFHDGHLSGVEFAVALERLEGTFQVLVHQVRAGVVVESQAGREASFQLVRRGEKRNGEEEVWTKAENGVGRCVG